MRTCKRTLPAVLAGVTAVLFSAGATISAQEPDEPMQKQTRALDESVPAPVDERDEPPASTSAEERPLRDDDDADNATMREPEAVPPQSSTLPPERPTAATTGVTPAIQAQFDALDTDHDGTLDRNEAAASRVLSAQFSALDNKGTGRLTIEQFAAATDIALIRNESDTQQQ